MTDEKENIERVKFIGVKELHGITGCPNVPQLPQISMTAEMQEAAIRQKSRDHINGWNDMLLHFALGPRGYWIYRHVYTKNGRQKVKNKDREELKRMGYKIENGKLKSTMTDEQWILQNISMIGSFKEFDDSCIEFKSRQGEEVS